MPNRKELEKAKKKEQQYQEEIEKKHKETLLQQVDAEKLGYENAVTYIKMLHVVQ